MKTSEEIIEILRLNKNQLRNKYGLKSLALFGSVSRGDATPISDVDILVEFDAPIGLDFILVGDELEKILGVQVDLVTKIAIKPRMYESIKVDLRYV